MQITAIVTLLVSLIGTTIAAPAVIWKAHSDEQTLYHSEVTSLSSLISSSVQKSSDESSLASVIFLVSRTEDGMEGLTHLTKSGSLPKVYSKYSGAHAVHTHATGIENSVSVAKHVKKVSNLPVVEASLDELNSRMASIGDPISTDQKIAGATRAERDANRRARVVSKAKVLVIRVAIGENVDDVDSAVSSVIDHSKVGSVILTSSRSITEVQDERKLQTKEKIQKIKQKTRRPNGRRLENQDFDDDNSRDLTGIYYVNFTPNIFVGLVFFGFFTMVTYIGIGCMNMIAGQDVYVKKYPTIGREM